MKLPWAKCQRPSLMSMLVQLWCRQDIAWTNINPNVRRHMVSLGHNEFMFVTPYTFSAIWFHWKPRVIMLPTLSSLVTPWQLMVAQVTAKLTTWRLSVSRAIMEHWYRRVNIMFFLHLMFLWAYYQIRKIASCAYAGNAGNVFPATNFKGNRQLAIPTSITARASHTYRRYR